VSARCPTQSERDPVERVPTRTPDTSGAQPADGEERTDADGRRDDESLCGGRPVDLPTMRANRRVAKLYRYITTNDAEVVRSYYSDAAIEPDRTVAHLVVGFVHTSMAPGETDAPTDVFRLLADEHSRRILLAADREPRTAKELSDVCDTSLTTVYRRISALRAHDLLQEHVTVGTDGAHRGTFETTFEELHVTVSDGELALSVETCDEGTEYDAPLWTNVSENR
jgi:hypothetical protein